MRNNIFSTFSTITKKTKKHFFAHHPLEKKASIVVSNEWNKLLLALVQSNILLYASQMLINEIQLGFSTPRRDVVNFS